MKKTVIASLVGGIIIFIWQTLSWTVLQLHRSGQQYTAKQDSIMAFLNSQFSENGSYMLPNYPDGATNEEMQKEMTAAAGKPWMQIQYHKEMNISMGMNIIRGLLVDIVLVFLICWILMKMTDSGFGKIFMACLITGIIVFLNSPYTVHIWYPKADLNAHFIDAVMSWGLCGLWLGWYLTRPVKKTA